MISAILLILLVAYSSHASVRLVAYENCPVWSSIAKAANVELMCIRENPYRNGKHLKKLAKYHADIILYPRALEPLFGPRAFTGGVIKRKGKYCYPVGDGLCLGVWAGSPKKEEAFSKIAVIQRLLKKIPLKADSDVSGWWLWQLERSKKLGSSKTVIRSPLKETKAFILRFSHDNYPAKAFVMMFKHPRRILSTLEGPTTAKVVANYYIYPALWGKCREVKEAKKALSRRLEIPTNEISMLYTGVDMDNIAFATEKSNGIMVWAAVTAGVYGNAMRAGIDRGVWLETPKGWKKVGTINIIIATNKNLTNAAMASAIIRVTEAKSAVLQELNVKSSYTPNMIATGTGTDNVMIISGREGNFTSAGGHTLLGYLIAKATRKALFKALCLQNAICGSSQELNHFYLEK